MLCKLVFHSYCFILGNDKIAFPCQIEFFTFIYFLLWFMFPRAMPSPPCYLFDKTLPIILKYGHYLFLRFCSLHINRVWIGYPNLSHVTYPEPNPGTFASSLILTDMCNSSHHNRILGKGMASLMSPS